MNKTIILIILGLSFFMGACSGKKGKTGAALSLKISSALDASVASHANGGGMIFGISSKGERFSHRVFPSQDMVLELPNDNWNFFGILWDGDVDLDGNYDGADMAGQTRCAKSIGNVLDGNDVDVVLNFNQSNCVTSAGTSLFKKIIPLSCKDSVENKDASSPICIDEYSGYFSSYQIIAVPYDKMNNLNSVRFDNGIKSSCYSIANNPMNTGAVVGYPEAYTQTSSHGAKIPVEGEASKLFHLVVRGFYSSEDCGVTGSEQGYHDFNYENGLSMGAPQAKSVHYNTNDILLYNSVTALEICRDSRLLPPVSAQHPFSFGSAKSFYHGLCTARQFSEIRENHLNKNYLVLRDLNFKNTFSPVATGHNILPCTDIGNSFIPVGGLTVDGGAGNEQNCTNPTPLGVNQYNKMFNGNNFTFINAYLESEDFSQVGLFRKIGPSGIVKNLKVVRSSVEGLSSVGMIAGESYGTIENVVVESSNLKVRGDETSSALGGIVGLLGAGQLNNVQVVNSWLDSRGVQIGGIVGSANPGSSISKAYFNGEIESHTDNMGTLYSAYVGGILGYGTSVTIDQVASEGRINSSQNKIGGIVAYQDSGSISNAYSTMVIGSYSSAAEKYMGGIIGYGGASVVTLNNVYFAGSFDFNVGPTPTTNQVGLIQGAGAAPGGTYHYALDGILDTNYGGVYNGSIIIEADLRSKNFTTVTAPPNFSDYTQWRQIEGGYPRLSFEVARACELSKNLASISNQATMGRGGASDPFVVCTPTQFANMSSGSYVLKDNINLLGGIYRGPSIFSGYLEGHGRIVHNYKKVESASVSQPNTLIGTNNGTLNNFVFANIELRSEITGHMSTGVIGINNGLISEVDFASIKSSGHNYVALAVVKNEANGIIRLSEIFGGLNGISKVGGVASLNNGRIEKVRVHTGGGQNIPGTISEFGVVAGVNQGIISEVMSDSQLQFITGVSLNKFGLIAGYNTNTILDVEVRNQTNTFLSSVDNHTDIAGIAGKNESGARIVRAINKATPPEITNFRAIANNIGTVSESYFKSPRMKYLESNQIIGGSRSGSFCNFNLDVAMGDIVVPNFTHINISNQNHRFGVMPISSGSGSNISVEIPDSYTSDCNDIGTTNVEIGYIELLTGSLYPNIVSMNAGSPPNGSPLKFDLYETDVNVASVSWITGGPILNVGDQVYYDGFEWIFVDQNMRNKEVDYNDYYRTPLEFENMSYSDSWNLVHDDPTSSDFGRIVDFYIVTELDGGAWPANAPKWRMEPGHGGPELMLDF